jgi:Kef-type K+ transport system membrane component KefB
MPVLYAISQVGLVLYMFMIGLEFDVGLILGRVRGAMMVSWAGIAVPLTLGAAAGVLLRDQADLFASHVSTGTGALYMGAAMSITAFPMLARIIHEKGISRTRLGTLTLAAGASDDAMAWCLLAVVLSQLEGSATTALLTIGGSIVLRRLHADGRAAPARAARAAGRARRAPHPRDDGDGAHRCSCCRRG